MNFVIHLKFYCLVMKLTLLWILIFSISASAGVLAQKVSLKTNNASLESVMQELRKQSGYSFVYKSEFLTLAKPVSLHVDDQEIEAVLPMLFENQPFDFLVEENLVTLVARPAEVTEATAVMILAYPEVRGRVVDSLGNPLQGATVRAVGASLAGARHIIATASTNRNGEFVLRNVPEDARLELSYVGYVSTTIGVAADVGVLVLRAVPSALEEVEVMVNTGYQSIPKERATGSFVSIDNELLNRRVSSDILSRLEGVASGLLFDRRWSGEPTMNIRGQSTILSNMDALIVVDNFPYEGSINNINPDDIEQVTILKDAAAASIWGSRASNGVIVITTKKGKLNTPLKISFNSNVTVESKPNLLYNPNFLHASDFIDVEQDLFSRGYYDRMENDITYPMLSPVVELLMQHRKGDVSDNQLQNELNTWRGYDVRTDFREYMFRQGLNHQYALNASGGSDKTDFYLSTGFNRHNLSYMGFDRQRATLNGSINFRLTRKVQLGTDFGYSHSINTHPNTSYETVSNRIYPYAQLMNQDGTSAIVARDFNNFWKDNAESDGLLDWYYRPMDELENVNFKSNNSDIRINNHIRYNIIKGLSLEARYQYQNQGIVNNNLYSESSYYVRDLINQYAQKNANGLYEFPVPMGGILDYGYSAIASHSGRLQGEYSGTWGKNNLNAIAGYEVRQMKNIGNTSRVYGYDEELINPQFVDYTTQFITMPTWSSLRIPHGVNFTDLLDRNVSYYANAAYTYNSIYTLSGSIRKDQSNLFGVNSNQKGVPLWSLGASWLISSESWYALGDLLDFLKLRTTFGYNGNINKTLTAYATALYSRNTLNGFQQAVIRTPANTSLRWEKMGVWNTGLDFRLWNGVLSGSVEYYRKNGTDLIGNAPLDPTLGFIVSNQSRFIGNNSDMTASGVDVQFNVNKNINKDLNWNAVILYNYNKDRITKFDYENTISSLLMPYPTPVVDHPRFSIFSYDWAGLDNEGDPQVYMPDGKISKAYSSIVNFNDMDILRYNGPAMPTQFGSFRNTFSYKDFSLGFNISYKLGHYFKRPSIGYARLYNSYSGHEDYTKRWREEGDEFLTSIPSAPSNLTTAAVRDNVYLNSSELIERADHIRLQDVTLGYILPLGKRAGYFNTLSIYGYVNNIGILWRANRHGIDPDFVFQSYPIPTTYAIGITLK